MGFHGAFGGTQLGADLLVEGAIDDHFHDLPLSPAEPYSITWCPTPLSSRCKARRKATSSSISRTTGNSPSAAALICFPMPILQAPAGEGALNTGPGGMTSCPLV